MSTPIATKRPCACCDFLLGGVGGWGGLVTFIAVRSLTDLWDRCYVTCCYAADGVGWGGGWDVTRSLHLRILHVATL